MNIKSLPTSDRPRERLALHGSDHLSTIELIAILLGSGTQSRPVLHLAADLLSHFGSLRTLSDATIAELKAVKGIGDAKAIQLKAAFALFSRIQPNQSNPLLDSPEKVYQLIHPDLSHQKIEKLMVILRDVQKNCVHREVLSMGTLTELILHPREIFHYASRHRAHTLIVAHNHPSGDPTPSPRDIDMTQLLVSVGKVVGIELSDHLIIGANSYTSFYNRGFFKRVGY